MNHLAAVIIYALRRHPDGLTAGDIAEMTGEPESAIRDALHDLAKTSTVEQPNRSAVWHLITQTDEPTAA